MAKSSLPVFLIGTAAALLFMGGKKKSGGSWSSSTYDYGPAVRRIQLGANTPGVPADVMIKFIKEKMCPLGISSAIFFGVRSNGEADRIARTFGQLESGGLSVGIVVSSRFGVSPEPILMAMVQIGGDVCDMKINVSDYTRQINSGNLKITAVNKPISQVDFSGGRSWEGPDSWWRIPGSPIYEYLKAFVSGLSQ